MSLNCNVFHTKCTETQKEGAKIRWLFYLYACGAGDDKDTKLDNGKPVDQPDCHFQLHIMTLANKK